MFEQSVEDEGGGGVGGWGVFFLRLFFFCFFFRRRGGGGRGGMRHLLSRTSICAECYRMFRRQVRLVARLGRRQGVSRKWARARSDGRYVDKQSRVLTSWGR